MKPKKNTTRETPKPKPKPKNNKYNRDLTALKKAEELKEKKQLEDDLL